MTKEHREDTPINVEEVAVRKDCILGIPSDVTRPFDPALQLNIVYAQGDAIVGMYSPHGIIYLPTIRFRSFFGGSLLPLISEELSILPQAFIDYKGQVPPEYKERQRDLDYFPSSLQTTVQVKKTPDLLYLIKNLPDDDANPDNNNKFMDIGITKKGNAIVKVRDTLHDIEGRMEFKTAENGGKFPIMAAVFTKIAERIAKAKKPRKD